MKGAVTVFQAILIFAVAVSMAAIATPWAYATLQKSLDTSEMSTVRSQLGLCNDKLIDTARTGTSNKCTFSANRGKITAQTDGVYYTLISKAQMCDDHDWGEVDKDRHLESMCDSSYDVRTYTMRWRWPANVTMEGKEFSGAILKKEQTVNTITFDDSLTFRTVSVVVEFEYTPGQSGKTVEISRNSLSRDKAVLGVNIK